MAKSVDPDQTAPKGAVCSGSTLSAFIPNSSVMFGNYLQQTTSADDIFRCIFLGPLRVKEISGTINITNVMLLAIYKNETFQKPVNNQRFGTLLNTLIFPDVILFSIFARPKAKFSDVSLT